MEEKICGGCSRDTHTDWVLKGEEGGMTTPLRCCSTSHGLMEGARFLGLEGEVTRRVGHGAPCLLDSRPYYLLRQAARNLLTPITMCWKGTSLSTISRVFVPIFFFGQSVVELMSRESGVPAESRRSGERSSSCVHAHF